MSYMDFERIVAGLDEAALIIGDSSRSKTYPKNNQILILAGGAGSGKGFVLSKLLAFEGKTFDVDALKSRLLKLPNGSALRKKFEEETGRYIESMDLNKPADVAIMHQFFKDNKIADKQIEAFFISAATTKNKPNAIFDVTLKEMNKLREISKYADMGGYSKQNIHIVWIINDIHVAVQQNAVRDRKVPAEILLGTHTGAAMTIKEIVTRSNEVRKYADGEIWFVFNKANVDSHLLRNTQNNFVIKDYKAVRIKKAGSAPLAASEIEDGLLNGMLEKINSYIPKDAQW